MSGQPRWEVWQAGKKLAAKAYDDGRLIYAAALGPQAGWIIAGRSADGSPWLEVSGDLVEAPEGWRGRLTVAAWVEEKKDDAVKDGTATATDSPAGQKKPAPVHPWAAGWGAPGVSTPRALFWGPDGWTQPDPGDQNQAPAPGVYPLLGTPKEGGLTLAGWQADRARARFTRGSGTAPRLRFSKRFRRLSPSLFSERKGRTIDGGQTRLAAVVHHRGRK